MGNERLQDALDGILTAASYCEDNDMSEECRELNRLYQRVARNSPKEHWTDIEDMDKSDFDQLDIPVEDVLGDREE